MKAVIVITDYKHEREFISLCASASIEIIGKIKQNVKEPNPKYYIGSGKVKELEKICKELNPDIVIFDVDLKPSQMYRLSKKLSRDIWDRLRLVLEIFRKKARTKEAKLQVELANLRYQVPIIKEHVNLVKRGEHPGFMGGGEYATADYLEMIKKRIKRIKSELESIQKKNESRNSLRKSLGFIIVSIAGYANAGKSSIAKVLSGYDLPIDNMMFSTIATYTKKIKGKHPILVIDTVGFVRNLPVWMIESFRTTFKSVYDSDLLLFVVDFSEDINEIYEKISSGIELLGREVLPPTIYVLNKIDLIKNRSEITKKLSFLKEKGILNDKNYVLTSVVTGEGIQNLILKIYEHAKTARICEIALKREDPKTREIMKMLLDRAYIMEYKENESDIFIKAGMHEKTYNNIIAILASSTGNNGGRV
ncbi:MAG: GTPase HflX [Euryarchaeota archaeon]|nr:GTPase HflX [Euryarchaeota archaeon]